MESEEEVKPIDVIVCWELFDDKRFSNHIGEEDRKAQEQKRKADATGVVQEPESRETDAKVDASGSSSLAFSSDQLEKILLRIEGEQKRTNFYLRFCAITAFGIMLYTTIN